ncbi:MAG: TonB-dependent receptor plug domain-containing protein [Bacteroidota bacterium]
MKNILAFTLVFNFSLSIMAQEEKKEEKLLFHKLSEVVITATKSPQVLAKIPVQTILITSDDIKASNAKNISELLASVPGIYVRGENVPGASAYQSSIRGLGFDKGYVLVLIDGERVLGGGMGESGTSVNQVPVGMIERIEIVEGAASALYGSDAMGGVINIITKQITEKPLFTSLYGRGEYDTYIAGVGCGQQIGKFGFLTNFNKDGSKRSRYSASEDDFTGEHVFTKFQYKMSSKAMLNLGANYDDLKWKYSTEKKNENKSVF